jgi:undecaprenyl-diphosphatase
MPPITYLGSTLFSILFCLIALFYPNETINALGVKTCITLFISSLVSRLIKAYVNRVRPFMKLSNLNIKKIGIDEYSFPSGHTTAAFSMAITTSLFYPAATIGTIVLAFCVGISRMYLGVHYPTDVLAGTFLGTVTSFFTYYII